MRLTLLLLTLLITQRIRAQQLEPRVIATDYLTAKGPVSRMWQVCVGAGRANEGLRADWQQQLAEVQKTLGFKYIRFHGLLHDDMGVYREDKDGKPVYNWQYIDKLYDFLLSVKIRPCVELSFMPSALAKDPLRNTTFWWKANSSPPKDYDKWSELITQLFKHFEHRYGHDEVKQWLVEVWNEPNLSSFWGSDRNEYFKLYEVTAKAVKSVSTDYKVGGPATAGTAWVREFINYCSQHQVPVDFIATHAYGSGTFLDQFGTKKQGLRLSNAIPDDINKVRRWMDSLHCMLPLHITEWNSSSGPKDARHDTYQNAAFVLHVIRHTEAATSMSYWTFTDIFEEPGPQLTPFHGGFGMINLQDIKKPTYDAYRFLSELGETELENTDHESYVCKDKKGNLQLLFWDFAVNPSQEYASSFFDNGDHPLPQGKVKLAVNHVPNGHYKLVMYKIGYRSNDPLNAYKEMGSPYNIDLAQEIKLKSLSNGLPLMEKMITVNNGKLIYETDLQTKEVYFIKLLKF